MSSRYLVKYVRIVFGRKKILITVTSKIGIYFLHDLNWQTMGQLWCFLCYAHEEENNLNEQIF